VPLIVRAPGVAPDSVVSRPVSLLDLAPTLIELGGDMGEADCDGQSLVGLLRGEADDHPPVICEYHAEGVNHPAAMIRAGVHKLIVCPGDPAQLYDLEADPRELENLAGRREHADVEAALRAELDARLDLSEIEARVLASQRERRVAARALSQGEVTPWDFQPQIDASMQYVRTRADLYEVQRRARLEARPRKQQPA